MKPEADADMETDDARVDAPRSTEDASVEESPPPPPPPLGRREVPPERVDRADVAPDDCVRVRGGIVLCGVMWSREVVVKN